MLSSFDEVDVKLAHQIKSGDLKLADDAKYIQVIADNRPQRMTIGVSLLLSVIIILQIINRF